MQVDGHDGRLRSSEEVWSIDDDAGAESLMRPPVRRVAINGAQEKTRTSTSLRSLEPESSASTNSATRAGGWLFDSRMILSIGFAASGAVFNRPVAADRL
jgi:hypothetical protein